VFFLLGVGIGDVVGPTESLFELGLLTRVPNQPVLGWSLDKASNSSLTKANHRP